MCACVCKVAKFVNIVGMISLSTCSSAFYASRPVVAKTAACYDAQHPSPPLLLQVRTNKLPGIVSVLVRMAL